MLKSLSIAITTAALGLSLFCAPLPVFAQNAQQMTPQQYQQYLLLMQQQQQKQHSYRGRSLPPCQLDSFVADAGGAAEMIYGDEGSDGPPPLDGFGKGSRINSGITSPGLTTGHGSMMPDAWGGDEWTGNEWDMSGI